MMAHCCLTDNRVCAAFFVIAYRKAYCTDVFGSTKLGPVIAQGLSLPEILEGCERVMNLLCLNFYMVDFTVFPDLDHRLIRVSRRVYDG